MEELENLLSGVCVEGKELVDQAASSGAEPWQGEDLGGCPLFLRMYCSVGRDLGIISCIQTCFIQQTF